MYRCGLGVYFILGAILMVTDALRAQSAQESTRIPEFTARYNAARDETERRALVIEAIDHGLISTTSNESDVKQMFGDALVVFKSSKKDTDYPGYVLFVPVQSKPVSADKNAAQSAPVVRGWFIDFTFSANGDVKHYSLSNIHKGRSAP